MRRPISTLLLAGALALSAAAPALPASSSKTSYQIFVDYTQKGQIDPCKYTTEQLQQALQDVDPDIKQYASDYPGAIRDAIRARASGACDSASPAGGGTTPATPATPAATPSPTPAQPAAPSTVTQQVVPDPPSPPGGASNPLPVQSAPEAVLQRAAAATPDNDTPAPLIGLGILALFLAMTAALLVALRRLGANEGRLAPAYHSWREARWRAGGVWDDFRDWLRLGR